MSQVLQQFKESTGFDIVTWKRPVVSGVIAGSIFAVWFVFTNFHYTLTTFISRILSIALIVGLAASLTKKVTDKFTSKDVTSHMDRTYESLRPHVIKAAEASVDVVTWKNFNTSAKVFVLTMVTAFLGNWLSDTTLFLLVLIAAFTLPIVYVQKKPEIDAQLKKVSDFLDKYLSILKKKGDTVKQQAEESMERKTQ